MKESGHEIVGYGSPYLRRFLDLALTKQIQAPQGADWMISIEGYRVRLLTVAKMISISDGICVCVSLVKLQTYLFLSYWKNEDDLFSRYNFACHESMCDVTDHVFIFVVPVISLFNVLCAQILRRLSTTSKSFDTLASSRTPWAGGERGGQLGTTL